MSSVEDTKAVVARWFTEFWGKDFNPAVIDDLAAPVIRFEYSLHAPLAVLLQGQEHAGRALPARYKKGTPLHWQ